MEWLRARPLVADGLLAPLRVPRSGGHAAHVNLIPYNPTPGIGFVPPSKGAVRRFRDAVAAAGVPVSVRANRGVGIDAACGQLRTAAGRPGRKVLPLAEPPEGSGEPHNGPAGSGTAPSRATGAGEPHNGPAGSGSGSSPSAGAKAAPVGRGEEGP